MGILNWKYNASDIADWFDKQDEKDWRLHDEWLIRTQLQGETRPVFVFASWFGDRMATMPQRAISFIGLSVIDVLRLGNDLDFDSWWGTAKGVFLNLTRLATIAGPAAEALGAGGRYAGMLATSKLADIEAAVGPCSFVSINNVLSYLRGRTVQLFAVLEDIIAVRGQNSGIGRPTLLASEQVTAALAKYGVTWERLGGLRTIDDVLRAAQASDGPIVFSIKWLKPDGTLGKHALTAVKDANGTLRILDYVGQSVDAFKGFGSLAEIGMARPQWGAGFSNAVLLAEDPVVAFSGRYLKLLQFGDGTFRFGVPVAMGLQWMRGNTKDERLFGIAKSAWRFLESRLEDQVPIPPKPSEPPPAPEPPPAIPAMPDAEGKRLGVSPLAPQATRAPRISWLTGVQYRLKYLGYYRGAIHGKNDEPTTSAVRKFQQDWFGDHKQWDSIPGPITQARLYSVVGW
jgi:hypothetical protein